MVAWLMLANLHTRDQIYREEWVEDVTGELSLGFSGIYTSRLFVRPLARQFSSSWENAWASLPLWAENSRSRFLSLFVEGNRAAHNCRPAFLMLTTSAVLSSVRSVCQILQTLCFLLLSVTQSFRPETSHGTVWHNKWLVGRVALVLPPTEPSCSHRHPCVAQLGTGRVQGALFFLSIRASDGFVMIGENAFPFQCALKRAHR